MVISVQSSSDAKVMMTVAFIKMMVIALMLIAVVMVVMMILKMVLVMKCFSLRPIHVLHFAIARALCMRVYVCVQVCVCVYVCLRVCCLVAWLCPFGCTCA